MPIMRNLDAFHNHYSILHTKKSSFVTINTNTHSITISKFLCNSGISNFFLIEIVRSLQKPKRIDTLSQKLFIITIFGDQTNIDGIFFGRFQDLNLKIGGRILQTERVLGPRDLHINTSTVGSV